MEPETFARPAGSGHQGNHRDRDRKPDCWGLHCTLPIRTGCFNHTRSWNTTSSWPNTGWTRHVAKSAARKCPNRASQFPPASDFHKGGMIAFGPDGYLYIGVGTTGPASTARIPTPCSEPFSESMWIRANPMLSPTIIHRCLPKKPPRFTSMESATPGASGLTSRPMSCISATLGPMLSRRVNIASHWIPRATNFGWSILEGHQWRPFQGRRRMPGKPRILRYQHFCIPRPGSGACS